MKKIHISIVLLSLLYFQLQANPTHGIVSQGEASFQESNSVLTIHATSRTILHWDTFSITSQETTHFIQGGSTSTVLYRVTGEEISHLLGTLLSDGKVYLLNPNGIVIGKEAIIDVGSFIAS